MWILAAVLEVLRQSAMSTDRGIDAILLIIAAVLLPAGVAVLFFGRSRNERTLDRR